MVLHFGGCFLDPRLLHPVDSLEHGRERRPVSRFENLAAADGCDIHDRIGDVASADVNCENGHVIPLKLQPQFLVAAAEQVGAVAVRDEDDHPVSLLSRDEYVAAGGEQLWRFPCRRTTEEPLRAA